MKKQPTIRPDEKDKTNWCECKSLNRPKDTGNVESIILDPNEYFDWGTPSELIYVDACISKYVVSLWKANIWTQGSCCGHNGIFPQNIILDNWRDAGKAHKIVKNKIELVAWKLITV